MITPKQIQQIVYLAGALALGIGLTVFAGHYQKLKEAAAQNESRGQVLENASAGVADGQANNQAQQEVDTGLARGRDTFNNKLDEAERNDPPTSIRSTGAVPQRVRDAFAERRRARERLGCAGAQCSPAESPGPASQR